MASVKIKIEHPDPKMAEARAQALIQINNNLSDKDVIDLARLLKDNPGIVDRAKKFLG